MFKIVNYCPKSINVRPCTEPNFLQVLIYLFFIKNEGGEPPLTLLCPTS